MSRTILSPRKIRVPGKPRGNPKLRWTPEQARAFGRKGGLARSRKWQAAQAVKQAKRARTAALRAERAAARRAVGVEIPAP